jgi:WD40 repeat protein
MSRACIPGAVALLVLGSIGGCFSLSAQGDAPQADQYLKLLGDENPLVRKQALIVLERLGPKGRPALPVLVKFLDAPDPRVRRWAATNLGRMGAESRPALDTLIASLNDADPEARRAKAAALDAIEEQLRLATLLAQVRDTRQEKQTRCTACGEMARRFPQDPVVRRTLEAALTDPAVKAPAAEALEAIDRGPLTAPAAVERFSLNAHKGEVRALAFSPYGKRLASAGEEGGVKVWDAVTGDLLVTMKGHTHIINDVTFSPDGRCLASCSYDKTVRVRDAATATELVTIKGDFGAVWSVAFSPDGKRVALGAANAEMGKGNVLKVCDAGTGKELLEMESVISHVQRVTFSPDGVRLASALGWPAETARAGLKVWDASNGKLVYERKDLDGHYSVAYSPDGGRLAVGGHRVRVLNASDGKDLFSPTDRSAAFYSVAFSPDGRLLAITVNESSGLRGGRTAISVREAETGKELLALKGHGDFVFRLAFSRDGSLLASGSNDGVVKIWDLSAVTARLAGKQERAGNTAEK